MNFRSRLLASSFLVPSLLCHFANFAKGTSFTEYRDAEAPLRTLSRNVRKASENKMTEEKDDKNTSGESRFFDVTQGMVSEDLVTLLRFGLVKGGMKDGVRAYNLDAGVDPLTQLVREMFPSHAGTLNTGTQAGHCIAKRFSNSPKAMAWMMDALYKVAEGEKWGQEDADKLLKDKSKFGITSNNLKKETEKRGEEELGLVTKAQRIFDAVAGYAKARDAQEALYGPHALERVLNTFVYMNLGSRKAVEEYITELATLRGEGNSLVGYVGPDELDRLQVLHTGGLPVLHERLKGWTEEGYDETDIGILSQKKSWTAEEILALSALDKPFTPYTGLSEPCDNSQAQAFSRTGNASLQETFADCTETLLRHFVTMMVYKPETRSYATDLLQQKLDALDLGEAQKARHPLSHMIAYFNKYGPNVANGQSLDQRSAWNGVVADLNPEGAAKEKSVLYKKSNATNEIKACWENMCLVLHHITGTKVDTQQLWDKEKSADYIPQYLSEVSKGFFGKDLSFEVQGQLAPFNYEGRSLTKGEIKASEAGKWEAVFEVKDSHATVSSIKDFYKPDPEIVKAQNIYLDQQDLDMAVVTKIASMTNDKSVKQKAKTVWNQDKSLGELERFLGFGQMALPGDNTGRISVLHKISELYQKEDQKTLISATEPLTQNLLSQISWDDEAVRKMFQAKSWSTGFLQKNAPSIKSWTFSEEIKDLIIQNADSVHYLNLPNTLEGELTLEGLTNLKKLDARHTQITKMNLTGLTALEGLWLPKMMDQQPEGLETLAKLKGLYASDTQITKMNLKGLTDLDMISLPKMMDQQPEGLETLKNLRTLRASDTRITKMNLTGLTALEELWLPKMMDQQPEGLETLKNLRTLRASDTRIKELDLVANSSLRYVFVPSHTIQKISLNEEFPKNLPNSLKEKWDSWDLEKNGTWAGNVWKKNGPVQAQ